jgi:hypothetical protein
VPPLYQFRVRSRVFRWYAQLRDIERRFDETPDPRALIDELNVLDASAQKIKVPLSYSDELYSLRSNIQLVRKKLNAALTASAQTVQP